MVFQIFLQSKKATFVLPVNKMLVVRMAGCFIVLIAYKCLKINKKRSKIEYMKFYYIYNED